MRLEIAAVSSCLLAVGVLLRLGLRLYDFTVAVSVLSTVADVLVGVGFLSANGVLSPTQPINKNKTMHSERWAGSRLTTKNWAESHRKSSRKTRTPTTAKTYRH